MAILSSQPLLPPAPFELPAVTRARTMLLIRGHPFTQFAPFFISKLANRLQHTIAGLSGVLVGDHQRFVNELSEQGQHIVRQDAVLPGAGTQGFGVFGCPATRKNRYSCQQALFSGCEQTVAPFQGCVQRLLRAKAG